MAQLCAAWGGYGCARRIRVRSSAFGRAEWNLKRQMYRTTLFTDVTTGHHIHMTWYVVKNIVMTQCSGGREVLTLLGLGSWRSVGSRLPPKYSLGEFCLGRLLPGRLVGENSCALSTCVKVEKNINTPQKTNKILKIKMKIKIKKQKNK